MIKRADIFLWIGLLLTFFVTRLVNLDLLPIFTDEAIYLRWSQIMAHDASLRFLPLTDGKPPLFMWLTTIVMRLLPSLDPLLSGRLVSVFAGLGSLIGIYFASYQLFQNKKISYLSSIFYLLSPFVFFYDRFALADALLAMFGIWALGLGVLLVKTLRLDVAMILGIVLGLGFLTKTPARFFLLLLPILLILRPRSILKFVGLSAVAALFAESVFSVLRLFPLFNMIGQKNAEFIVPLIHWLDGGNLKTLVSWELTYLTPLVVAAIVLGLITGLKKFFCETIILSSLFLIHLLYMTFFNKVIYPRFLLTFTPYLLILAALGLNLVRRKIIWMLIFFYPAFVIFKLLVNPVDAPLLQADRDQYVDGWPAGFGVREVRHYLSGLSGRQIVATEGTFGLMPFGLELYQKDYPKVEIKAYWPLPARLPEGTNYLLMYQQQIPPVGYKLEEVLRFRQGKGESYLRLYKVLP